MKRSIVLSCLFLCVASLLVTGVCIFWITEKNSAEAFRDEMRRIAVTASVTGIGADYPLLSGELSAKLSGFQNIRVTYFSQSGRILGDSHDQSQEIGVPPEVRCAFRNGWARGQKTGLFFTGDAEAVKLSDGKVLRIYAERLRLGGGFSVTAISLLLGVFAMAVLLPLVSDSLYERVFRSFALIRDSLRKAKNGAGIGEIKVPDWMGSDELAPLFRGIEDFIHELSRNLSIAATERRRIESLLNSMSEGLIVTDPEQRVMMINNSAAGYFKADAPVIGRNLLHLTRLPAILNAVAETSKMGTHSYFDFVSPADGRKILQVFVSPLRKAEPQSPEGGGHSTDYRRHRRPKDGADPFRFCGKRFA